MSFFFFFFWRELGDEDTKKKMIDNWEFKKEFKRERSLPS